MRTFRVLASLVPALAFTALALPTACASRAPETGAFVTTNVQRDRAPVVAQGAEAALVAGNAAFAFDLYHALVGESLSPNLFYSPYSISLALAMTYAGAAGDTATQMASALHFTLPPATLHPTFDALDLAIQKAPSGAIGADGQPFAMRVADALFGDQRLGFAQGFVDTLARDYGAGLRRVDFVDAPDAAEADINQWVAAATNDRIDPLLVQGAIKQDTRFVIVNAVDFDAAWQTQFEKGATETGPFTRADGSTVDVPMMRSGHIATAYAKGDGWQAVELPYSGSTTSLIALLPDAGAYATVDQDLTGDFYASLTAALVPGGTLDVTMPHFAIHGATVSLVPALKVLGMTDAFDRDAADFRAMIPRGGTWIGDVLHQATIDVDESGTEATAATAVVGVGTAIALPIVNITLDRPFFFFIRDRATNALLFFGKEGDPSAR